MAYVTILGLGKRFELGQTTTLGRMPGCGIVLADKLVSANHAEIRRTPENRYLIIDLKSTHGTYVGGNRVYESILSDGDEIFLGMTRLQFQDRRQDLEDATQVDVEAEAASPWIQTRMQFRQDTHFPPEHNVTDMEELRCNYEKLRAAYELTKAIGAEDDLDMLLERIVDTAFGLLPADRAAVLLVNPKSGKPEPRIAKRRQGGTEKIILSKSIIQEVVQQKTGFVLTDAGKDSRFESAQSIISQGIRSAMCVPMLLGKELVGIMHLDSQVVNNAFGAKDLELFASIAVHAALAVKNVTLRKRIQDEAKTRLQLQRFLSPSLVEQVVGGKLSLGKQGQLREVTVLFADIRGFTRMSENMQPAEIVELLNAYFEILVGVLFRHGGTFDKYMGDGLMALFGFPVNIPEAPLAAVRCGLEMHAAVESLNRDRRLGDKMPIEIGVGIHTGEALCGTIGSSKAMQYTAIGDTVNTASRLCALADPGTVVVGERTLEPIAHKVLSRRLPDTRLKGKSSSLNLYCVQEIR